MEIIPLLVSYNHLWDDFCQGSNDAWFWHTTDWLDYLVSYGSDGLSTKSLGFAVSDSSGFLAVCPLFIEEQTHGNHWTEFSSGFDGYTMAPALRNDLTEERREKILRYIFSYIDKLAMEHGARRARFKQWPPAANFFKGHAQYNYLHHFGFIDNSISTQIINLEPALNELWGKVRKGHRYDIRRGEQVFDVIIYDQTSISEEVFEKYRLLHFKAAGRATRPRATFDMMFEWVRQNKAVLCGLKYQNEFISFAYVNAYKEGAVYSSACDDPDSEVDIPTSHVIQWQIIKWLKGRGFKWYELGNQYFGCLLHNIPSKKDVSISFFKRGFGGYTAPLFQGEKFYDEKLFLEISRERSDKIAQAIAEGGRPLCSPPKVSSRDEKVSMPYSDLREI